MHAFAELCSSAQVFAFGFTHCIHLLMLNTCMAEPAGMIKERWPESVHRLPPMTIWYIRYKGTSCDTLHSSLHTEGNIRQAWTRCETVMSTYNSIKYLRNTAKVNAPLLRSTDGTIFLCNATQLKTLLGSGPFLPPWPSANKTLH